jgi:hypothetical protein
MLALIKKIYYFFKNLFVKKNQELNKPQVCATSSYVSAQESLWQRGLEPQVSAQESLWQWGLEPYSRIWNICNSRILQLNIPRISPKKRYEYSQKYMHVFRSKEFDTALAEITQDAQQEYVKMGHY